MAYNMNQVAAQQQNILGRIMPNRYGQPMANPAQPAQPTGLLGQPVAATAAAGVPTAAATGVPTTAQQPAQSPVSQPVPGYQMQVQPQTQYQMPSGANPNPWLQQQAQGIAGNITQNFQNTIAPQIRGSAIQAGGYGGSRQGIAEGLALQGMNRDIANAQANLFSSAYESDANRANTYGIAQMQNQLGYAGLANQKDITGMNNATTRDVAGMNNATTRDVAGMNNATTRDVASMNNATTQRGQDLTNQLGTLQANNSYNLGVGQLGLGYGNLGLATNNANAANQLAAGQFGLNVWDAMNNANTQSLNAGTTIQNTPLNYWSQFSNVANQIGSGLPSTTSTATGNPFLGALAGYQLGNAFSKVGG